jgi:glycine betaine catabolism B
MFGLLHTHKLIFEGRDAADGDAWSLRFHPTTELTWRAGQHVLLRLPGMAIKPFTLASAPQEGSVIIGTSLRSQSSFKQKLAALTPGDRVAMHGPLMNFSLDGAGTDVVMLAQGIGITPFRSMLRHLVLSGAETTSATLIHVATGHAYRLDTEPDATRAYYPHHADEFTSTLTEVVGSHPEATYFIAGHRGFVNATAATLKTAGIARQRIRRDTYYGYTPRSDAGSATDTRSPDSKEMA